MSRTRIFSDAERRERHRVASLKWYREQSSEEVNKKRRKFVDRNRERHNAYQRAYRKRSDKYKWYKIKSRYGLKKEEYLALLKAQNGRCAICGFIPTEALAVDHEHITGKVRGLLCKPCNLGIANFKENSDCLQNAIAYLRSSYASIA